MQESKHAAVTAHKAPSDPCFEGAPSSLRTLLLRCVAGYTVRRAHFEIFAALATGTTFVVANPFLSNKLYFIVPCILAWLAYLVSRVRGDREALRDWGLRTDNLRAAVAL